MDVENLGNHLQLFNDPDQQMAYEGKMRIPQDPRAYAFWETELHLDDPEIRAQLVNEMNTIQEGKAGAR